MKYRSSRPGRQLSDQRGAALVVAMLIFALCTALIVAMKSEFMLFYQRGANTFIAEQAHAYLRGAEELASLFLVQDFERDQSREHPRDDLQEPWAQPATPYTLDDGGWLVGGLEDLQGRFNLNNLKAAEGDQVPGQERVFTAHQQQFIRLLQALENNPVDQQMAIQITEAIGDWIDVDNRPRLYGAEDDYYYVRTPAYRAANRPMRSVSELQAIAYVTPQIYHQLKQWVTVWPVEGAKLNIHTASLMLLRTINEDNDLNPLSMVEGEMLVEARKQQPFQSIEAFLEHPILEVKDMEKLKPQLGESSDYFLLDAKAEVAERTTRLYSVLHRNQREVATVMRVGASAYVNNEF